MVNTPYSLPAIAANFQKMTYQLVFTEPYNRRAAKFIKKHSQLISQYEKTLQLLELNPFHNSLRLHKLQGRLSELHSVSINMQYSISLELLIQDHKIILVAIGDHRDVY